jgi:hypothetical protein
MGLQDRDWYWAERDRKERENAGLSRTVQVFLPSPPPPTPPSTSARFGEERAPLTWRQLGFLTIIVAALIWTSFSVERAVRHRAEVATTTDQARKREKERALAEQTADERRRHFAALAAMQDAERARAAAARAEVEAAAKAKAEEEARQAASWQQAYRPEPQCGTSWTVDCANAYIRAKRKFAAQSR